MAGRYLLQEPLGRGGMGEVWRGRDERLQRPVAVKALSSAVVADRDAVARFRREAEIAANLNHPGITTVFDIDEHVEEGGHTLLFLVMELLQGRDLHSVVAQHPGGVPIEQVTEFSRQILDALGAAHGQGVTHRDIKPANLFLLANGRVKVCDFGIARLADATGITSTGGIAGTPLYMAPEQIQARPVDQRTDLYSFGCVLYELLTGAAWVDTTTGVASLLYQHLGELPAAPSTKRPEIPEHLDRLVLDLLAKDPADRPPTAAAALALLNPGGSAGESESTTPGPAGSAPAPGDPGTPPPTVPATAPGTAVSADSSRPRRSRRTAVLTGAAVVLAMGAVGVGGSYMTGDRWWRDPPADVHPLRKDETASGTVMAQGETARIPFIYNAGSDPGHTSFARTTLGVTVTSIAPVGGVVSPGGGDTLYCVHFTMTNLGGTEVPARLPTDGVGVWKVPTSETFSGGLLDGLQHQTVHGRPALLMEGVLSDGTVTTAHLIGGGARQAVETPTCRPHAPGRVAPGQSVEQAAAVNVPAGSVLTGARWTEPTSTGDTPADDAHSYWIQWR
ncbi:serine/threonine-protein kinase [Kitasatospora sp. NPDC101183]|uniref:serine/threonine-protein kinase n=1 Tax=Kitasatospora sp. NPDC101183 TaxID=3364100 RepID=UPI0038272F6D